jgi:hypothetical protein
MSNNDKERAIVRELARKVSEIAAEPRMSLIIKREGK